MDSAPSATFLSEVNGEPGGDKSVCRGSSTASSSSVKPVVSIAANAASICAVRSSAIALVLDLLFFPGPPKMNLFISATMAQVWGSSYLMMSNCLYSQNTKWYMIFDTVPVLFPGNSLSGERRNISYYWNKLAFLCTIKLDLWESQPMQCILVWPLRSAISDHWLLAHHIICSHQPMMSGPTKPLSESIKHATQMQPDLINKSTYLGQWNPVWKWFPHIHPHVLE